MTETSNRATVGQRVWYGESRRGAPRRKSLQSLAPKFAGFQKYAVMRNGKSYGRSRVGGDGFTHRYLGRLRGGPKFTLLSWRVEVLRRGRGNWVVPR